MSQGPRTRVRLDGFIYHVVRSSRGIHIYARRESDNPDAPGTLNVLVYDSRWRPGKSEIVDVMVKRILAAEAESI